MANTIEVQTIEDGERNYIIRLHIEGDGSGEETATQIIDVSTLHNSPTSLTLMRVSSAFVGFSAELYWDATANVHFWILPDYIQDVSFDGGMNSGIPNNAGTGVTGDVLVTTMGLVTGESGHAYMWFIKKYD